MTPQTAINQTVAAELAARKLTKDGLAASMNLDRRNLYNRLSGRKAWTISELEQVATYIGAPIWELFSDAEERQQKENPPLSPAGRH